MALYVLVLDVGILGVNALGMNPSWVDHFGVVRNRVLAQEGRDGEHRQQQRCGERLLHGPNVARSGAKR